MSAGAEGELKDLHGPARTQRNNNESVFSGQQEVKNILQLGCTIVKEKVWGHVAQVLCSGQCCAFGAKGCGSIPTIDDFHTVGPCKKAVAC